MYTTYHFKSAAEITTDVIEAIKTAFKGKSIVLTVEEDLSDNIPEWHKKIVYERLQEMENNPNEILDELEFQKKLHLIKK